MLGPGSFGAYATVLSFASIASILIDGGFSKLIQREGGRPSSHLPISAQQFLQFAYGHVVVAAILILGISAIIFPLKLATLFSALLFTGVVVFNQIGLALLRGEGRLIREAFLQILNRSLTALAIIVVVLMGANLPWEIFGAQFLGALVFTFALSRILYMKPNFKLNWPLYKILLPFVWLDLASVIYFRADMIIFDFLRVPISDVGHYSVAYRLIEAVIMVSAPVGVLIFRWIRRNFPNPRLILSRLTQFGTLVLFIALVVSLIFYLCAESIIRVAYGDSFNESATLLQVLCWGLVFIIPNGVLGPVALALAKEKSLSWLATIIAFINVGGNLIFIPKFGVIAAAWMTVLTEFFLASGLIVIILVHIKEDLKS